jgi:uncharacterized protein (DUF433 family)
VQPANEENQVELPRYQIPEAARYVRMPVSTLTTWVAGRDYRVKSGERHWAGIIRRPDPDDARLSYSNLIEAHVLKALRRTHKVPMPAVRTALDYARDSLGVDRVLLSSNLRAMEGNVFIEHLGHLINLGKGGQEAMIDILHSYLKRVRWDDENGTPLEYFPWTRTDELLSPEYVSIIPAVAFGRPIVRSKAITTSIISERFNAGESFTELAEDYDLEIIEVEEAIRYERLPLPTAA